MSFDKFPLDQQRCMFRVGSYSYDSSKMVFITKKQGYSSKKSNSIALDYEISKFQETKALNLCKSCLILLRRLKTSIELVSRPNCDLPKLLWWTKKLPSRQSAHQSARFFCLPSSPDCNFLKSMSEKRKIFF